MKKALPFVLSCSLLVPAAPLLATCGGGGGGGVGGVAPRGDMSLPRGIPEDELEVYRVPWKVLLPNDPPPAGVLVLYWFPIDRQEERYSELQSSRQLTLAAARCVAMVTVTTDNQALRAKYDLPAGISAAVLVAAADGSELGRVQAKHGPIGRDDAEKLLKQGLTRTEDAADKLLDQARTHAEHGDREAAVGLYKQVWEERCVAARAGKKAAKALRKLGQPVPEERGELDVPARPDERPATEKAIAHELTLGLRAENDLEIERALAHYEAARRLDPADPVPLRYLGELYRHHLGDWTKARASFASILAMPADPLSRAVALHGLGKMTIHGGQYQQGLDLFAQSIAEYPLALTYRNLAVYWSSEGKADKAYGYVEKAMALEPDDEYNQIFAATFLVELGKPEEAAAVARAHEKLLAASYNLAAIWAQLGQRDKALELLRRHFYVYERFDQVRREEMQEARVDIVFARLKKDPAFIELTKLADGGGMGR